MISTEERNPATAHFDEASTAEMLRMMDEANRRSVDAVREALPQVARVVDAAAAALAAGGRLVEMGRGGVAFLRAEAGRFMAGLVHGRGV